MPVPSNQDWSYIVASSLENWNLPNCLGSIDGKHVVIQALFHACGVCLWHTNKPMAYVTQSAQYQLSKSTNLNPPQLSQDVHVCVLSCQMETGSAAPQEAPRLGSNNAACVAIHIRDVFSTSLLLYRYCCAKHLVLQLI